MIKEDSNDLDSNNLPLLLKKISDAVGCSVEDFTNSNPETFRNTSELLNLWLSIDDVQDQAKVLAFVRSISAQAQASGKCREPLA